jgi:hypothetical protein
LSVIHLALITNFFLFPVFCFSLLQAQDLQSAQQASRADSLVRLEHTTHPLALLANDAGRVEADKNLQRIVLVLAPSSDQENELGRFLDEQQNRNSKNYHQWLTPRQFAERFSPADPGIEAVRNWLQQNGLTVGQVAAGKRWIEFSGTARQVEAALHTELHYYNVAGKNYLANSGDVSLPSSLAALSRGVVSLNNFPRLPPRQFSKGAAGRDARGQFVHLRPNLTATGQSNTYYLAPGDFAAIYNSKPLLSGGNDGTGVSIAVIAQSNIEVTDVQAFRSIFGLKANDPNILYSGPDPGFSSAIDSQEAMLDTEWAGAVAPGATINVVIAGSTDTTNGVDLAAAYAIDNEIAPILTYTYGSCEAALGTSGNAFYNALWQQAAAEGITVVVAAGDNGAAGCDNATEGTPATQGQAINGAASTPYNLAVGGTQLADVGHAANYWNPVNASDFSSAIGYIPEQAWNESCDPGQPATATNCVFGSGNFTLLAGAGGASTVYSKPAWQTGPGVPADGARDVPDVALAAASDHDDIVYCNSLGGTPCQIANGNVLGLTLVGGTSVSTPAMAGILALVEQKEGSYLGQVNYTLYQLAKTGSCNSSTQTSPSTQTSCIFYDVTAGNNSVPCAGGTPGCSTQAGANGILAGQAATTGFDMATGLGSLNVTNLANAWSSAKRAASQTTLHTASSSFAHGTAITVNGSVAPATGSGSPTGDVSLKTDLYGDAGLLTLSGGAFSSSLNILPGGKYNLFAHYAGDASYGSSDSAQLSLTVTPEASITNLSLPELSGGVAAYGSTLPIKVNVAGVSGAATATGNITIFDNNTIVGNYTLAADGGAYVLTGAATGNSFAPGAHSLTAKYAGDNSFDTSTSNAVAFTIGKSTPQVILGANTLNVNVGASVAVHAVVVASSGFSAHPATGTIQFTDNGATILSPVTLQTAGLFGTQSQASAILPNLSAGTHVIGATYNAAGDPNYNNVASGDPQNEFLQTVTVGPSSGTQTTTRLSVTAPVNMGDTASFSINVSPATATGSVAVWDAVGLRGSPGNISGGTVTISLPWTQAGNTAVYAVYSGNASNAPSSSTPVPFTVNKLAPQVQLVAPAGFSLNQQTSLNVTVAGRPSNAALPYPTGSVEFWDSLNGGAPQLLSVQMLTVGGGNVAVFALRTKLPPGSHSLHAHYRGDTNWLGADSAAVALSSSDFTVSVSPNPLLVSGGSAGSATVSVAPAGGFTGIVALSCPTGGTAPPAGYACTFSPSSSVDVTVGSVSATLTLAPATAAAATVKQTALLQKPKSTHSDATIFPGLGLKFPGLGAVAGLAVAFGISLLILFLGMKRLRPSVGYAAMAATALTVIVIGCGGGSGGGGGTPPVASTTTLTSSNLKAQFQAPVNFNVNVSSAGSPTGMVQLYDNGQVFGNAVPLNAGLALFTSDALPVGLHSLSAKYQGDTNTLPSTSASISQIITGTVNLQITASSQSGASHTANFNATVN